MTNELETGDPTLRLRLICAPDDPPLASREYQSELADFDKSLRAAGIGPSSRAFAFDAVAGAGGLLGEFGVIASAFGPVVGVAIGAFLNGRYGRKVRLEIGKDREIKAEAQTITDIETLLRCAEEFQQRHKPKVIREA